MFFKDMKLERGLFGNRKWAEGWRQRDKTGK
jgi:hypothetical protein